MSTSISVSTQQKLMLNVLLEQNEKGQAVATVLTIPNCQAEGVTRQQALDRVQQILADRLSHAEIVPIEVKSDASKNPLMKFAGMFEEDPFFAEIAKEMRMERQEVEDIEPATYSNNPL